MQLRAERMIESGRCTAKLRRNVRRKAKPYLLRG